MASIGTTIANLKAGARLALFLPVDRPAFRVGLDQAVILLLIAYFVEVVFGLLNTQAVAAFNVGGLSGMALKYLTFLFAVFVITRVQRAPLSMPALLVMLVAAGPVVAVGTHLAYWSQAYLPGGVDIIGPAFWILATAWALFVVGRGVRILYRTSRSRAAAMAILLACISWIPLASVDREPLW